MRHVTQAIGLQAVLAIDIYYSFLGKESYSWKIAENGKATKYKVTVQASATGYQDVTSSTVFKVKPATTTTSTNDHNSIHAGTSSHENRNKHNNDNSFEETTIHSSWNDNRNNDRNNNNGNSLEVITDSSSHEKDQNINNNNNFGESMTDNINDFTHEIIDGVNDMIKIYVR